MKRRTVLTTVFSILGGIILASGCGVGKTASTNNSIGTDECDTCMQACVNDCMDSCYHCSPPESENQYDCYTIGGFLGFWLEFNCIICSKCTESCFQQMISGNCGNSETPQE